uniref:Uncharacterized protein MANES_18G003900 n=1 Tax=Rhizophora mucronata TaxID=61149 RepID=A0A2P2M6A6_RHIMU
MAIGLPSTRNLPSQGNPERPPRIPISLRGLQVPSSFSWRSSGNSTKRNTLKTNRLLRLAKLVEINGSPCLRLRKPLM